MMMMMIIIIIIIIIMMMMMIINNYWCVRNGEWKYRGITGKDWYLGRFHHAKESYSLMGSQQRP